MRSMWEISGGRPDAKYRPAIVHRLELHTGLCDRDTVCAGP